MIGQMQSIINSASLHTPSCNSININSGLNYQVLDWLLNGTNNHIWYKFNQSRNICNFFTQPRNYWDWFSHQITYFQKLVWKLEFMETCGKFSKCLLLHSFCQHPLTWVHFSRVVKNSTLLTKGLRSAEKLMSTTHLYFYRTKVER